jgi:hypothetical protein
VHEQTEADEPEHAHDDRIPQGVDPTQRHGAGEQHRIRGHGGHRVQGVESDRAPLRVIHGIREQMVDVHEHRGHQDQPCVQPTIPRDDEGDYRRRREMKHDMKHVGKLAVLTDGPPIQRELP